MPSTLIRLAVALLAFGLGVSATMLWIAYRTPDVRGMKTPYHIERATPIGAGQIQVSRGDVIEVFTVEPNVITTKSPISGGVLNGKAISKPAPVYPPIAKAARASGTVVVQVVLDETGRVISAKAVSGHPLLQQAVVQAAYQARFSPTLLAGQPVKVSGALSYNFVLQ